MTAITTVSRKNIHKIILCIITGGVALLLLAVYSKVFTVTHIDCVTIRTDAAMTVSEPEQLLPQAQKGDEQSQVLLAQVYIRRAERVSGNKVKEHEAMAAAAEWYLKAAMQDNHDAEAGLARLYESGQGVKQSYAEAYFWMLLAMSDSTTFSGEDINAPDCDHQAAREKLASQLIANQKSEVEKRAAAWKPMSGFKH